MSGTPDIDHRNGGWAAEAGDTDGAIILFQELLKDRMWVLGLEAPDTLTTRTWLNRLEG